MLCTPSYKIFFYFAILLTSSTYIKTTSIKWFIDNPGFDDPAAWESEYLPCALEEVVFPEYYSAVLPLPKDVDISGLILPTDGAILLNQDATITLGGELKDERSCENGRKRKAYLKEIRTKKWYDPQSWRTTDAMSNNKAFPHMEQVPCNNDSIIIRRNGPISFDLENIPHLRMGQLNLAGSSVSKDYLINLLHTQLGEIMFHNIAPSSSVQYYHNDVCGCHVDYDEFVEPICHNVVETCPKPHCLAPIMPFESCCSVCGAYLRFSVERCEDGNYNKLRKIISAAINDQKLGDDLDYHVSYISTANYGNFLQAIVVDRNGYSEQSVAFVNALNASTDWAKLFAGPHPLTLQYSGRPYNPNVTFGSVLLIILCFMFVLLVTLVIFAHYQPENHYLSYVPVWLYEPRRWRAFLQRYPIVFARFENTGAAGATNAAAESDIRESIIMGYDAESGQINERARAFDNPMFGEQPPTTTEQDNAEDKSELKNLGSKADKAPKSGVETTTITTTATAAAEDEQELTEINLESASESESDDDIRELK